MSQYFFDTQYARTYNDEEDKYCSVGFNSSFLNDRNDR